MVLSNIIVYLQEDGSSASDHSHFRCGKSILDVNIHPFVLAMLIMFTSEALSVYYSAKAFKQAAILNTFLNSPCGLTLKLASSFSRASFLGAGRGYVRACLRAGEVVTPEQPYICWFWKDKMRPLKGPFGCF